MNTSHAKNTTESRRRMRQTVVTCLRGARRLASDERGVELVEFLGFFPLVLLALVLGWQIALVGYAGILASGAAREGARAAATRENVERAVSNASPGFDGRRQWSPMGGYPCMGGSGPVTVQVRLEVPRVSLPFVGALRYPSVTSTASARCEPRPR